MGFKKFGRKMNIGGIKKIGKRSLGTAGKIGKKGGRAVENIGKVAVSAGVATGQPELVAVGGGLIAGGKTAQRAGQIARDVSKGKLEKATRQAIKMGLEK